MSICLFICGFMSCLCYDGMDASYLKGIRIASGVQKGLPLP